MSKYEEMPVPEDSQIVDDFSAVFEEKPSKKKPSGDTAKPLHPVVDLERWITENSGKYAREHAERLAKEMTALGLVTREDFFSQTGQQRLVKATFAAARLDAPTIMGLLKESEDDVS